MSLKGIVKFFNNIKGLGFVSSGGEDHFVHQNDVRMRGFRTLVPGWEGEFEPSKGSDGRPKAKKVLPPADMPGLEGGVVRERDDNEFASNRRLRIDATGRVYALGIEKPMKPDVASHNMRAYYMGRDDRLWTQFSFTLPASTRERGFALLDQNKNPRKRADEFTGVAAGSYVVVLEASGRCTIWCIGRRFQAMPGREIGDNWLVIERRFEHKLDLADSSEAAIKAQLPTSGLDRDNHQFASGIARALREMHEAQE